MQCQEESHRLSESIKRAIDKNRELRINDEMTFTRVLREEIDALLGPNTLYGLHVLRADVVELGRNTPKLQTSPTTLSSNAPASHPTATRHRATNAAVQQDINRTSFPSDRLLALLEHPYGRYLRELQSQVAEMETIKHFQVMMAQQVRILPKYRRNWTLRENERSTSILVHSDFGSQRPTPSRACTSSPASEAVATTRTSPLNRLWHTSGKAQPKSEVREEVLQSSKKGKLGGTSVSISELKNCERLDEIGKRSDSCDTAFVQTREPKENHAGIYASTMAEKKRKPREIKRGKGTSINNRSWKSSTDSAIHEASVNSSAFRVLNFHQATHRLQDLEESNHNRGNIPVTQPTSSASTVRPRPQRLNSEGHATVLSDGRKRVRGDPKLSGRQKEVGNPKAFQQRDSKSATVPALCSRASSHSSNEGRIELHDSSASNTPPQYCDQQEDAWSFSLSTSASGESIDIPAAIPRLLSISSSREYMEGAMDATLLLNSVHESTRHDQADFTNRLCAKNHLTTSNSLSLSRIVSRTRPEPTESSKSSTRLDVGSHIPTSTADSHPTIEATPASMSASSSLASSSSESTLIDRFRHPLVPPTPNSLPSNNALLSSTTHPLFTFPTSQVRAPPINVPFIRSQKITHLRIPSSLCLAALNGHAKVLTNKLLANSYDPVKEQWMVYGLRGFGPLHFAVLGGHMDCMRILLCSGFCPNEAVLVRLSIGNCRITPTGLALLTRNASVLRLLLENGGKIEDSFMTNMEVEEKRKQVRTLEASYSRMSKLLEQAPRRKKSKGREGKPRTLALGIQQEKDKIHDALIAYYCSQYSVLLHLCRPYHLRPLSSGVHFEPSESVVASQLFDSVTNKEFLQPLSSSKIGTATWEIEGTFNKLLEPNAKAHPIPEFDVSSFFHAKNNVRRNHAPVRVEEGREDVESHSTKQGFMTILDTLISAIQSPTVSEENCGMDLLQPLRHIIQTFYFSPDTRSNSTSSVVFFKPNKSSVAHVKTNGDQVAMDAEDSLGKLVLQLLHCIQERELGQNHHILGSPFVSIPSIMQAITGRLIRSCLYTKKIRLLHILLSVYQGTSVSKVKIHAQQQMSNKRDTPKFFQSLLVDVCKYIATDLSRILISYSDGISLQWNAALGHGSTLQPAQGSQVNPLFMNFSILNNPPNMGHPHLPILPSSLRPLSHHAYPSQATFPSQRSENAPSPYLTYAAQENRMQTNSSANLIPCVSFSPYSLLNDDDGKSAPDWGELLREGIQRRKNILHNTSSHTSISTASANSLFSSSSAQIRSAFQFSPTPTLSTSLLHNTSPIPSQQDLASRNRDGYPWRQVVAFVSQGAYPRPHPSRLSHMFSKGTILRSFHRSYTRGFDKDHDGVGSNRSSTLRKTQQHLGDPSTHDQSSSAAATRTAASQKQPGNTSQYVPSFFRNGMPIDFRARQKELQLWPMDAKGRSLASLSYLIEHTLAYLSQHALCKNRSFLPNGDFVCHNGMNGTSSVAYGYNATLTNQSTAKPTSVASLYTFPLFDSYQSWVSFLLPVLLPAIRFLVENNLLPPKRPDRNATPPGSASTAPASPREVPSRFQQWTHLNLDERNQMQQEDASTRELARYRTLYPFRNNDHFRRRMREVVANDVLPTSPSVTSRSRATSENPYPGRLPTSSRNSNNNITSSSREPPFGPGTATLQAQQQAERQVFSTQSLYAQAVRALDYHGNAIDPFQALEDGRCGCTCNEEMGLPSTPRVRSCGYAPLVPAEEEMDWQKRRRTSKIRYHANNPINDPPSASIDRDLTTSQRQLLHMEDDIKPLLRPAISIILFAIIGHSLVVRGAYHTRPPATGEKPHPVEGMALQFCTYYNKSLESFHYSYYFFLIHSFCHNSEDYFSLHPISSLTGNHLERGNPAAARARSKINCNQPMAIRWLPRTSILPAMESVVALWNKERAWRERRRVIRFYEIMNNIHFKDNSSSVP